MIQSLQIVDVIGPSKVSALPLGVVGRREWPLLTGFVSADLELSEISMEVFPQWLFIEFKLLVSIIRQYSSTLSSHNVQCFFNLELARLP